MYHKLYPILFLSAFILCSCKSLYNEAYQKPDLVDSKLTRSTKKLHKKLYVLSKKGFAIGQQDATSYGIRWKQNDSTLLKKSDMMDLSGDFPAVFGFDIGHIELGDTKNLDSVNFVTMKKLITEAYKEGGLITVSWHADNPITNGSSWDTIPAVNKIISKGEYKEKYNLWIERVAKFFKSLKYRGRKIPVIFRPYHEMNGSWFWWGANNCIPEDYKKLWIETITSLRDEHKVHNLLYAYSPNWLNQDEDYLKYYPGDNYVDILGIDIYDFEDSENYKNALKNDLNLLKTIATAKNKLYALTETGLDKIDTTNWFTNVLYPTVKNSGISWVLFWRNARESHHYIPFQGQKNATDFIKFAEFPKTLFLKDIKEL
ncbi:glycoside hydrolase family 26 protein [Gaetbulibacter aestuarii]|uniref:Mannan endo-1,4-beta-mannosidase n=1 Tax=Gaetbulibacter aestuarii TaxID=1502358 RepID=A0ABW7N1A2_9FLAO